MGELFKNQTVIISGGLGDIGRAIAWQFAGEGASIAIGDLYSYKEAKGIISDFEERNLPIHYHQVDVSDANAVQFWVKEVEKKLGIPGIIIANAAVSTISSIREFSPDQWSRDIRVNLDGAFFLTQTVTNRLINQNLPGKVIFVGSWAAHAVHPELPAYCVSKAGIRMLSKCMALELAPYNILVNEIALGYVDAGLSGRIWENNPELKKESLEKVPVKKLLSTEEVARKILQMCDSDNGQMTGSTVLMDGGLSLLSGKTN